MDFRLITGRLGEEIEDILKNHPDKVYMISAFITYGGAEKIVEWSRFTDLQLITGTYLDFTNPEALSLLHNKNITFRVLDQKEGYLHAKAYFFIFGNHAKLIIGSANLTHAALYENIEWSAHLTEGNLDSLRDFEKEFRKLWLQSREIDKIWLDRYRIEYRSSNAALRARIDRKINAPLPRDAQTDALKNLKLLRENGENRALVVMATGLGKTHLAAFDSAKYSRILFLAHRVELLRQAELVFKEVRQTGEILQFSEGWWTKDRADVLLATVQKLGKSKTLSQFDPQDFNYIVIDEFHHASSAMYRRIIDHFAPHFLLGLTATPFRMDRKDITELCDFNIPYSINFVEAIERKWLSPFEYYGVYDDTIDYNEIPWKRKKYDTLALENAASTEQRASMILEKYLEYRLAPAVAFCVSISHADFMAKFFNEQGIPSIAVHSHGSDATEAKYRVQNGEIEVIFAVDIFNEGVDLPSISTVLFLRPTQSLTVFIQQLGRGLRLSESKKKLLVLDFVGNYRKSFIVPTLLLGKLYPHLSPEAYGTVIDYLSNNSEKLPFSLPEGCSVHFDMELIELMKTSLGILHPVKSALIRKYWEYKRILGDVQISTLMQQDESIWNYILTFGSLYDFYKEVGELSESQQGYNKEEVDLLRWLERKYFHTTLSIAVVHYVMTNSDPDDLEDFINNFDENLLGMEFDYFGKEDLLSLVNSWFEEGKFRSRNISCGIHFKGLIPMKSSSIRWDELENDIVERISIRTEKFRLSFKIFEPYTTTELIRIFSRKVPYTIVKKKLENRMGGIIRFDEARIMLLFVTLDKNIRDHENTMYDDYLVSPTEFQWESQNQTTLRSKNGKIITGKLDYKILLLVRLRKADAVYQNMHIYMGEVKPISYSGEEPIQVTWRLEQEVPDPLFDLLSSPVYRKYKMPKSGTMDLLE